MERVLILWSGGVESTSLLKHFLESTESEVIAVHIHCPNFVGRSHLELGAVQRLEPRLQAIRPFRLDRVNLEFPVTPIDAEVFMTTIPALVYAYKPTFFLRGQCAEDWANNNPFNPKVLGKFVWDWVQRRNFGTTWEHPEALSPTTHPWLHLTKKQHMEFLGDLVDGTWSCLAPVHGWPCGKCPSCEQRNS
jgi:7-cyano-7-deazaguanine synthase in queuosine biosynthesis